MNIKEAQNWIKTIQLDAMREGMKKAACLIIEKESPHDMIVCRMHDTICNAAEQLTEKDLPCPAN